jgi:lipopolysaccharide transport system ATP-binding protein
MIKPRVRAEGVCKSFRRRSARGGWRALSAGVFQRNREAPLWALRGVSFEVAPGQMLGIVGANGAGKSTLLRLLGGIGRPTTGTVRVDGRIGALLELGGSFQGDLSGRDNAMLAGVVAGLLRGEVRERLPAIIDFAELEDFIDAPVRTYSTGMAMRLAFAVAVHTDPEVMLVDEHLAVGDLAFQAKCAARIAALRAEGCAIILVSHGMDQVKNLCDRALWLRHGEVVLCDSAAVVAEAYQEEMREESLRRTPEAPLQTTPEGTVLRARENRIGSLEMEITSVVLRPGGRITSGAPLELEISYCAPERIEAPVFVVSISGRDGAVCMDTNTEAADVTLPDLVGRGSIRLTVDRLDLGAGAYFVDVGVFAGSWSHAYDYHWHVYHLNVEGLAGHKGLLAPPCSWMLGAAPAQAAGEMAGAVVGGG